MYQDMMDTIGFVAQQDPEVGQAMVQELKRQRRNLELIASENIVSPAVMAGPGAGPPQKKAGGGAGERGYGGHGLGPHQQIRGGVLWQTVLRRLRGHRRGGDLGD